MADYIMESNLNSEKNKDLSPDAKTMLLDMTRIAHNRGVGAEDLALIKEKLSPETLHRLREIFEKVLPEPKINFNSETGEEPEEGFKKAA